MPPTIGGMIFPYARGQSGTESAASLLVTSAPAIRSKTVQLQSAMTKPWTLLSRLLSSISKRVPFQFCALEAASRQAGAQSILKDEAVAMQVELLLCASHATDWRAHSAIALRS